MQHPQQMNNTPNQEDHVSDVQNHVLIEEHQVSNSVDHVSKVKQQRSQKDPLPKEKNHVSKIDQEHVSKAKEKHDINHVSKVHQEHLHENPYLSLQLKHLVSQMDHVFEVKVSMLTYNIMWNFLACRNPLMFWR
jgi:Ca2+-dependent lipid-binding protein